MSSFSIGRHSFVRSCDPIERIYSTRDARRMKLPRLVLTPPRPWKRGDPEGCHVWAMTLLCCLPGGRGKPTRRSCLELPGLQQRSSLDDHRPSPSQLQLDQRPSAPRYHISTTTTTPQIPSTSLLSPKTQQSRRSQQSWSLAPQETCLKVRTCPHGNHRLQLGC